MEGNYRNLLSFGRSSGKARPTLEELREEEGGVKVRPSDCQLTQGRSCSCRKGKPAQKGKCSVLLGGGRGWGCRKSALSCLPPPPLLWSVIAVQYTAGTIDHLLGLHSRLDVLLANTMYVHETTQYPNPKSGF